MTTPDDNGRMARLLHALAYCDDCGCEHAAAWTGCNCPCHSQAATQPDPRHVRSPSNRMTTAPRLRRFLRRRT